MTTLRLFSSVPCLLAGTALITSACSLRFDDGTDSVDGMLVDAGATTQPSSSTTSTAASDNETSTTASSSSTHATSASSTSAATGSPTSDELTSDESRPDDTEVPTSDEDSTSTPSNDTDTSDGDSTSAQSTTDATSSESTTDTDTSDDTEGSDEVPATEHCAAAADWDPEWSQWEEEVLQLVNEYRAEGADCGEEGVFGPADPLAMDPVLRCSSRLHSLDMFERDFFDHTNPDGLDPFDRMDEAGFSGSYMGENIAMGQTDPVEVMEAWIDSDGHCSNVMSPNFTLIGVGYYPGSPDDFRARNYWTQNFGTPQESGGGFGGFGN